MRTPKSYKVLATVGAGDSPQYEGPRVPTSAVLFELVVDPTRNRKFEFSAWLGKGIDQWVWSCVEVLRVLVNSGTITARTMVNYAGSAVPKWFAFLTETQGPARPQDLAPEHVKKYVNWLRLRHPFTSTAQTLYSQTKPVLIAMSEHGLIPLGHDELFPINPFAGKSTRKQGPTSLTHSEIARLASALKKDLIAIHRGEFVAPDSEALAVAFLVIALRTGINTTPLLEASRDCLAANPFVPNMMIMKTFKRRGNGRQTQALRKSEEGHETSVVPMDGVAVLNSVIARTASLVKEASPKIRDRLWLYRSQSHQNFGRILALSVDRLQSCIGNFANRHKLMGDDGKILKPTPPRLRKTMESKLWQLSDGDLASVAAAVGHTPNVADQHYLHLTNEMKSEAARFVGLALPAVLRGDESARAGMPISIRKTVLNTPVGRCANAMHGKNAPKNGVDRCDRFTECLTCPTFVVVGSVKDLHRLFSFQQFLLAEIEYMRGPGLADWREYRQRMVGLIDSFTDAKFSVSVVAEAKTLAKNAPHPFWAARLRTVTIANEGPNGR